MKQTRLSSALVAVSAASLLVASSAGFASHKPSHHKAAHKVAVAESENFKGETNFKAEVPPCPPVKLLSDGFYVGVGAGYDSYRLHQSTSVDDDSDGTLETTTLSMNHNATGWMGNVFVGYGRFFDWFYLAAEVYAATSGADTTMTVGSTDGSGFSFNAKARTSYGVAPLFGVKLNDSSLFYGRVGYTRTNMRVTLAGSDGAGDVGSVSSNRWRNGTTFGVGLQTYVAENVSVRGEFDHTSYNSTTVSTTLPFATKFTPSNNEFNLALIYSFA